MDYMENVGYELKPYQIEIINAIKENIDKGNRMQSILLPNAGGKTSLSFILSIMFTRMGKKVMYFSNTDMDKNYACRAIRTSKESFDEVDFGNEKNIKNLTENHYDIVITDAITGYFDADTLSDFTNRIKSVNIPEMEEARNNASIAQRQLVALHYLQEIIEKNTAYVISFELNRLKDIGYAPIIAAPHVLTFEMNREEQIEYGSSCALEYENLSKKKMEFIQKSGASNSDVQAINAYMEVILQKFDMLDIDLSRVDEKIDNLQNDVSKILSDVEETNAAIKGNKEILDLFFSVHGEEDDLEADLFISKLIDRMTQEIADKIASFEGQGKYQQTRKLVMVRLGDDAWNKLEEGSRKFLVTAKFMFMENMDLSEDIDYSSICLLSSKALEVELAKRFVVGYQEYLNEKNIPENRWPKGIMTFDKRRNCYEKMKTEDFTLGSCPYVMGILGSDTDKRNNRQYFEQYCYESLLKGISQSKIREKITEFNGYIRHVKDNYRNPAAHKNIMSMSEASGCLDYILEVERVLKIMLEQFAY